MDKWPPDLDFSKKFLLAVQSIVQRQWEEMLTLWAEGEELKAR